MASTACHLTLTQNITLIFLHILALDAQSQTEKQKK